MPLKLSRSARAEETQGALLKLNQRLLATAILSGLVTATFQHACAQDTVTVTASPTAKAIDLNQYQMVFNEDFAGKLDVSSIGPNTRWVAHTPWFGDFGDAPFADPTPDFPFTIKDRVLRIEARKDEQGKWHGGLLASNNPKGAGFSLQYGYFEFSAKLPTTKGVWPAFWLVSSSDKTDPNGNADGSIEIDVIEYYGHKGSYQTGVHVWKPEPHHAEGATVQVPKDDFGTGFHNYGTLVTPEWIIMYRDRREVWRKPTPKEHKRPLMLLVNLSLGGGWPIDEVKNPTYMYVRYLRAYAPKKTASGTAH